VEEKIENNGSRLITHRLNDCASTACASLVRTIFVSLARAYHGSLFTIHAHIGRLKFVLLQNCFVIYRQVFLTFIASKKLKLSFTLNCVLNDFKKTRFAFEVLQKFKLIRRFNVNRNRS